MLWLWRRLAAVALIHLLAWEPPYATGLALKRQKTPPPKKKKKKGDRKRLVGKEEDNRRVGGTSKNVADAVGPEA